MNKAHLVVKANGDIEPFNEDKIRNSLLRSGASPEIVDDVVKKVKDKLYENIPTKKLYEIVFSELRKKSRPNAGKYHLKRAIMELGPTGFPFESYIAELFKSEGYHTITGQIIMGQCVKHEVDVIAENKVETSMVECKFHSSLGNVCDVKTALYVHARFEDIERNIKSKSSSISKKFKGWLITNTRMTSDAEKYGVCAGLNLLSWDFPKGSSLRERIDHSGLHPITCLTSLTRTEKEQLMNKMIVLSKSLSANPAVLSDIGIKKSRASSIIEEAKGICQR